MNDKQDNKSMRDNVLAAIESGKVRMRPRWQYVLRTALLITGIVLISLTALYLVSFIVFMLRETGTLFIPGFGFRYFGSFLSSLPWILIILAALFMVLLQILIKRYSFSYGRPFIYSAALIIVLVIVGGFIIDYTRFHERLFHQAQMGRLPFAGSLYRQFDLPHHNFAVGEIVQITKTGYIVRDPHGRTLTVNINKNTQLPPGANFKVGDMIVILGEQNNGNVQARGLEKPGLILPPPPPERDSTTPDNF